MLCKSKAQDSGQENPDPKNGEKKNVEQDVPFQNNQLVSKSIDC